MAIWTFIKNGAGHAWEEDGVVVSNYDDGLNYVPGEEGFTEEFAEAKAKELGKGVSYAYSGTPGWHLRLEAEAKEAAKIENERLEKEAVNAALDKMLNPPTEADKINAQFDAMLTVAPERKDDIEALRKAELEKLSVVYS